VSTVLVLDRIATGLDSSIAAAIAPPNDRAARPGGRRRTR